MCVYITDGQTGSGKTFTMFGPSNAVSDLRGVIPRCAEELFNGLDAIDEVEEVTIKCSFLEIYKEVIQGQISTRTIRTTNGQTLICIHSAHYSLILILAYVCVQIPDLLNPKNINLRIREERNGEVYVQGLSDEYVSSADDIMALLAIGEKHRTVASTDMNEVSSRSHSVLIIVVTQKLKDGSTRIGKLNMADLAGSERIERTNATGVTLEEAKMINQSLSALGNCINALTDSKRTHIPFRDSTLTFLLKDSLGGNTKTTLLVCCSGEESDIPETLSTLNFAKRAKKIKNQVSVNTVMGVKELTAMVEGLKRELQMAQRQIVALQRMVKVLREGGQVDDSMVKELMRPPALAQIAAGAAAAGKEEERKEEEDRSVTGSPVSTAASSVVASAYNTNAINSPVYSRPTTPKQASSISNEVIITPSSVMPTHIAAGQVDDGKEDGDESEDGEKEMDIAQIREMIADAKKEAQTLTADNTVPPSQSPSPPPSVTDTAAADAALIATLRQQLEAEKAHSRRKARELHVENSQLRVEKEMLRVSSRASDALISNLTTTVKALREDKAKRLREEEARAQGEERAEDEYSASEAEERSAGGGAVGDGDMLSELLTKNERLERQMADMKDTWASYLDLILENQKLAAAKQEKKEREKQVERDRQERERMLFAEPNQQPGYSAHRARIVKPVRLGHSLFSPPKVAVPVGASPLARQPSPSPDSNGASSVLTGSPASASSSLATPAPSSSSAARKSSGAGSTSSTAPSSTSTATPSVASTPPPSNNNTTPSSSASSTLHTPHSSITSSILSSLLESATNEIRNLSPFSPTDSHASSIPSTSATPLSASTAASNGAGVSRSTLEAVLKRGFLFKKQMGWSMSMSASRAWRKRLFLLRPNCLDYYEHNSSSITITPSTTSTTAPTPASSSPTPAAATSTAATDPLTTAAAAAATSATSYSTSLTGALRGTIPLDLTTLVRLVDYDDVRFGFEIVTRDKEAKLHASSGEERDEWVEEVKKCVYRLRRGVGMKDDEIVKLESMQEKADAIESAHPSRAVEL